MEDLVAQRVESVKNDAEDGEDVPSDKGRLGGSFARDEALPPGAVRLQAPDCPPEGAEYVDVRQKHSDRPGELVPDDLFQNTVRVILDDIAEEGPEVIRLAVAPVPALDEVTKCGLVAVGGVESDPQEGEALDILSPFLPASVDPGACAAHSVLVVLALGSRSAGRVGVQDLSLLGRFENRQYSRVMVGVDGVIAMADRFAADAEVVRS